MSKERRVDQQVTVGLLCDARGFPLAVQLFEGNKAETKTFIPVLDAFREAHDVKELVFVTDPRRCWVVVHRRFPRGEDPL